MGGIDMIEESYVSFDTARLLKEAGFEAECGFIVDDDGRKLYRPTQALAAKWLREVYHVLIILNPTLDNWILDLFDLKKHQYILCNKDAMTGSYEAAFETALREAIKLIKK